MIYDRVKVATATTGTGTVTLGSVVTGGRTFAAAGVSNGEVNLPLLIEDLGTGDIELSRGVYSSTGPTVTRVLVWSTTGSLLNLSGNATVAITAMAADLAEEEPYKGIPSGYWVNPVPYAGLAQGGQSDGTLYLSPFFVPRTRIITDIACTVVTGGTAAATFDAGIWANLGTLGGNLGRPDGAPLAGATGLSAATNTAVSATLGAPVILTPGWYWMGLRCSSATPRFSSFNTNGINAGFRGHATLSSVASNGPAQHKRYNTTLGTLPTIASEGSDFAGNGGGIVYQKVQ